MAGWSAAPGGDQLLANSIKHGPLTFYRRSLGKVFGVPIWAFRWPQKAVKVKGWL